MWEAGGGKRGLGGRAADYSLPVCVQPHAMPLLPQPACTGSAAASARKRTLASRRLLQPTLPYIPSLYPFLPCRFVTLTEEPKEELTGLLVPELPQA